MKFKKTPKRILLIATRQIGDVLLVTPLLRTLRMSWPKSRIYFLGFRGKCGILEGNPDINQIIEISERPDRAENSHLFRRIFRRYDLAITTQAGDRPHLYAFLAAPKRVGLVNSMGIQDLLKRWLCHRWVLLDNKNTHTVLQNLRLAEVLKLKKYYSVVPPTATNSLPIKMLPPWVVVHPHPMWRYKYWHQQGWIDVIQHLLKKSLQVVITGGPNDQEIQACHEIAQRVNSQRVFNLSGQTYFPELSYLLSNAVAYVGPDTAVTHLAAACRCPVLAIYGPTNPIKWSPWPADWKKEQNPFEHYQQPWQQHDNVLLLQGEGDCVPCHEEGCERHRNSRSVCLERLPSRRVIQALDHLLESRRN